MTLRIGGREAWRVHSLTRGIPVTSGECCRSAGGEATALRGWFFPAFLCLLKATKDNKEGRRAGVGRRDPTAPLGGRMFLKNVMVMTRMGRLVPSEKDSGEEKSGRKDGRRRGKWGGRGGLTEV